MEGRSGTSETWIAESIRLKVILHLMKLRVLLYGWSCFSEMRPASLLKATVADGPQPPLVDRTNGANAICNMRIHYGPRECDMRIRSGPREYDKRYAIREYAMGRANAICDMRIRYGLCEQCDMRYANRLRAMSNFKVSRPPLLWWPRKPLCDY